MRLRLSDAQLSSTADATPANYRCVCPPPLSKAYVGNNCFGTVGSPCVTLLDENKRHNLDTKDRPALPKAGTIWECAFYGGHLASTLDLAEAVQQNIGPGSSAWLHTANEVHASNGAGLRWSDGKNFVFQYTDGPNSITWMDNRTPYAFRCVGENYAAPRHPAAVEGEWAGPGRRKIEKADLPVLTKAIEAVDVCFNKGGHLPTMAELGEMVLQGLPGGSGTFLWTSDQTGSNTTDYTLAMMKWSGVDTTNLYGGADMGWTYRTDATGRPHRCIYYPVDVTYTGPPPGACSVACTTVTMPGASGAKIWIDAFDRSPAVATTAIDECRKLGGHLPSERDLTEAIRAGLPNGSGVGVVASDPSSGSTSSIYLGLVTWQGVQKDFADVYPGQGTWSWPPDLHQYRCMWTNELR